MRNALGSRPQWRENPYLHLLAGESGQRHRRLKKEDTEWIPGSGFSLYQVKTAFSEGWWAGRIQVNFLSLGRELFLKADLANGMRRRKETGILLILVFLNVLLNDEFLAQRLTPNLEDHVICDRGFLPLAFDKLMSSCKAADATLVRHIYFISPVPAIFGEHFPIRHLRRGPMGV